MTLQNNPQKLQHLPLQRFTGHEPNPAHPSAPVSTPFSHQLAPPREANCQINKLRTERGKISFFIVIIVIIPMLGMSLLTWLRYHHKSTQVSVTQRRDRGRAWEGLAGLRCMSGAALQTVPPHGRRGGPGGPRGSAPAPRPPRAGAWARPVGAERGERAAGRAGRANGAGGEKWTEPPCCCL